MTRLNEADVALRLMGLLLLGGWVAGDAGASTSSPSTQCPEHGEYRAGSQAEVDAFAENYCECEQLISLKVAIPIYLDLFGYDPIDPVVSLDAFQRNREVGDAFYFAHAGDGH